MRPITDEELILLLAKWWVMLISSAKPRFLAPHVSAAKRGKSSAISATLK